MSTVSCSPLLSFKFTLCQLELGVLRYELKEESLRGLVNLLHIAAIRKSLLRHLSGLGFNSVCLPVVLLQQAIPLPEPCAFPASQRLIS